MLENSNLPENQAAVTGIREKEESGEPNSVDFGELEKVEVEENDRNSAGNRWPRQETLALLQIRSDMDTAFRDANVKAPLWEEVSRKLSELGYCRSAKKCKEKFENIYKYHRRTKEGRSGRPNGKTYRFFQQLEALDSNPLEKVLHQSSMSEIPKISSTKIVQNPTPCSMLINQSSNFIDTSTSTTSCSSKESEGTNKKKRKFTEFFKGLMKQVIEKQENLQRKFIETLEKCEQDRIKREEQWKLQELARINRERELLAQERSISAAKDSAVLAFLKKYFPEMPENQFQENFTKVLDQSQENSNCGVNSNQINIISSNSRWPKDEVEALIKIRTSFEMQYQENLPKGPLWEEISIAMKKLGYDRSAKRCKEKWENINKYFKRVKESNKKRPEDSKTCPYFHQLDALYREKSNKKVDDTDNKQNYSAEELLMHMMGGQDQEQEQHRIESATEDQNEEEEEEAEGEEEQDQGDNEEDDDQYQVVAHTDINNSMEIS